MSEQRESITFTKEVARELEWGSAPDYEVVENVLYDNSRWALHYRLTIKRKSDGKFFQATYRRGATESQDERPFEYTDPIFTEVYPVQKTITVYAQASDELSGNTL